MSVRRNDRGITPIRFLEEDSGLFCPLQAIHFVEAGRSSNGNKVIPIRFLLRQRACFARASYARRQNSQGVACLWHSVIPLGRRSLALNFIAAFGGKIYRFRRFGPAGFIQVSSCRS